MKTVNNLLLCLVLLVFVISVYIGCDDNTDFSNNNSSNQSSNNSDNIKDDETDPPAKTQYCVTLDYNDGSGRQEIIYIPEGEYVYSYAPYPVDGNKEVVSWSHTDGGSNYQAPVTSNITLYAQWKTYETAVYTNEMPSQINDRFAEVYIEGDAYFL